VNEFERRMARLEPNGAGLNPDTMLFAAGKAAGRRGQRWWAGLTGLLALVAVGVGLWGWSERRERFRVVAGVIERPSVPASPALDSSGDSSPAAGPDGYFHLRRQAEQDPNTWLSSWRRDKTDGPVVPQPVILRSGQRDALIDP
jgi:hypothetical protein